MMLFIFLLLGIQLSSQDSLAVAEGAAITWEAPHIHIGSVTKGEVIEMEFKFTNTGTEDLVVEIASGCECTTLDWPRKPIKSGESGAISAVFDSEQKDKSESVAIDVNFANDDPKTGYPMMETVSYTFELEE